MMVVSIWEGGKGERESGVWRGGGEAGRRGGVGLMWMMDVFFRASLRVRRRVRTGPVFWVTYKEVNSKDW